MYPPPGPLAQLVDELIEADPLLLGRLVKNTREEGRSEATFDFNISEVEVDLVDGTAVISDVLDAATEPSEVALEDLLQLFQFADQLSPALTTMLKREFGGSWRSSIAWLFALPERAERFLVAAVVACGGTFAALPGAIELGRTDWRDLLVSGGLAGDDWRTKLHQLLSESNTGDTPLLGSNRRSEQSGPRYADEFDVHLHEWDRSTRPCDFSLALGDVAFADFSLDADHRPVLLRISFDGYGCCTPEDVNVAPMNPADSSRLLGSIESGDPLLETPGQRAARGSVRHHLVPDWRSVSNEAREHARPTYQPGWQPTASACATHRRRHQRRCSSSRAQPDGSATLTI